MFGVNAGYDSRPMNTGNADTGVDVTGKRDVFFQQVAAGLEAVSESWNFNAYGLFPVGDTEQVLNDRYSGGALHTYGLDVGYAITPEWDASIGYYYQHGDDLTADDGSGVLAKLSYEITDGLKLGVNVSYDEAFETRVSGNIEYRFGSGNATEVEKKKWQTPVIQALTESVRHRDVRVHDGGKLKGNKCSGTGKSGKKSANGNKYHCSSYSSTCRSQFDRRRAGSGRLIYLTRPRRPRPRWRRRFSRLVVPCACYTKRSTSLIRRTHELRRVASAPRARRWGS